VSVRNVLYDPLPVDGNTYKDGEADTFAGRNGRGRGGTRLVEGKDELGHLALLEAGKRENKRVSGDCRHGRRERHKTGPSLLELDHGRASTCREGKKIRRGESSTRRRRPAAGRLRQSEDAANYLHPLVGALRQIVVRTKDTQR
jgi:hypothetical protein